MEPASRKQSAATEFRKETKAAMWCTKAAIKTPARRMKDTFARITSAKCIFQFWVEAVPQLLHRSRAESMKIGTRNAAIVHVYSSKDSVLQTNVNLGGHVEVRAAASTLHLLRALREDWKQASSAYKMRIQTQTAPPFPRE